MCFYTRRYCKLLQGSTLALLKSIDFRDSEASCDQFPQALLDLRDEVRIAPNNLNVLVAQIREIICREWQSGDPARINVKCDLLAQFHRSCLVDEKVLPRAPRTLVLSLGGGVEDDCKAYIAFTSSRRT